MQSAMQTVTLDVTSEVAANVIHLARPHTGLTLPPTRATVCSLSGFMSGLCLGSCVPNLKFTFLSHFGAVGI